jgi:hypothetical protein
MKRITIDVADDFEATADELMDLFVSAQIGQVFGVQIDEMSADEDTSAIEDKRLADRIDGYDRDDLGESPDY